MSTVHSERVLVVPTRLLNQLGYFQGFSPDVERYMPELLSPRHTSYRPRDQVEHDPSFKQLIPYVIFQHRDAAGHLTVFQYTRGTGQGEGRLHRKRSVGVGGHISADDAASAAAAYDEGMRRELEEEVAISAPYTQHCVGLINDDQTEVGRVHLGVVHVCHMQQPAVQPRECDIMEAGFRPIEDILADLAGFETWSQICLRALYATNS